jgi:hypothetical protein
VSAEPTNRPSRRAIAAWFGLLALGVLLGGAMGVAVAVVVAALVLARRPRSEIGLLGVATLACVPLFVLLAGLPSRAGVSPAFVTATPWSHRLAFAGLLLAGTWAVLDVLAGRRTDPAAGPGERAADGPADDAAPQVPAPVAVAIVVAVAVGALVASMAVLAA